jgi:alkanesulfonate monooxygenase SsuD/methylene tetrahydromethanopterin reductase-like flavin-dependent oxidoreductase (luciferase family)
VARWADGWYPLYGRPSDEARQSILRLRELTAEAGRDPDAIEVSICAIVSEAAPMGDVIREWEAIGAHRVVLFLVADEVAGTSSFCFDRYAPGQFEATLERLAERWLVKA